MRKFNRDILIGEMMRSPDGSLRKLFTEFFEHTRGLRYSTRTLECFTYDCKEFIKSMENTDIATAAALTRKDILIWAENLVLKRLKKNGIPLKARTVNKKITSVRAFLKYLFEESYLSRKTAECLVNVKEPKTLPVGVMSYMEVKRLFSKINTSTPYGYRDRTIMELLYSSGLRADELVNLRLSSVDIDNSTIRVFGKGQKERVVPVGKTALRYLETYLKAVRMFLLKGYETDALFVNQAGTALQYYTLLRILHKYRNSLNPGIPITLHTFRRSCATELIRGGANMYHVKELLGHESLATLKHYAKLTITDLKKTHAKCHPREKDA